MATVAAPVSKADYGDKQQIVADVTMSNSYTTGGEALTAANFGFRVGQIDALQAEPADGYVFEWLPATGKLKAYYFDIYGASADGPGIEVANGVNLSSVSVRCVAIGR